MKVSEATDYGSTVTMRCKRGHEHQVEAVPDDDHRTRASQYTASELNRGLPCPTCLDQGMSKDGRIV